MFCIYPFCRPSRTVPFAPPAYKGLEKAYAKESAVPYLTITKPDQSHSVGWPSKIFGPQGMQMCGICLEFALPLPGPHDTPAPPASAS